MTAWDDYWSTHDLVSSLREMCPHKEPDVPAVVVTADGHLIPLDRVVTDGTTLFLVVGDVEPPTPERAAAVSAGMDAYAALEAELDAREARASVPVEVW
jgi:hypothetical protein